MSSTRQFSKVLAIASNYDIPDAGIETVKSNFTFNAPTVSDGLEFAEFEPFVSTANPDWVTFDLYAISVTAQVAPLGDIVFDLFQRPDVDLSATATLTLGSGTNFRQSVAEPPAEGLAKTVRYFIKCSCDEGIFAEGVQFTYVVGRM